MRKIATLILVLIGPAPSRYLPFTFFGLFVDRDFNCVLSHLLL